ncbi:ADP-ribosylglycohydrolase family protein [hydrothermal vent metagenome]|uniref:ADP-ribosylglycohydrolase family protein n=1 Tax=hydrothermal vent metagenome TaxID=652676 RepID=A0A3B0YMK4_9ZZZZ
MLSNGRSGESTNTQTLSVTLLTPPDLKTMTTEDTITLLNMSSGEKKNITLKTEPEPYYIEILDGIDSKEKFIGRNIFDCFKNLNHFLQEQGWLPLCNGARMDVAFYGMQASSCASNQVYLLDEKDDQGQMETAYIFGSATEQQVGTIEQHEIYQQEHNYKRTTGSGNSGSHEISLLKRYYGCLWGLACGDALGTAVEFRKPGSFIHLTDIVGGGLYNLKPGQWTDDTSMALCLASSLLEIPDSKNDGFDPEDQLKKYIQWRDSGYMSSTDRCFDIGNTVAHALLEYKKTGNPYSGSTDPYSAGNGSIMRLAPIALRYFYSIEKSIKYAELSSKITHGAEEAVDACHLLVLFIHAALSGKSKEQILFNTQPLKKLTVKIDDIRKGSYTSKSINEINGDSYVVNSLEAALWCFYTTSNYKDAVLKAANLGNDADTTAAICGQIAGAYYGSDVIPTDWKHLLAKRDMIRDTAKKLFDIGSANYREK